MAAKSKKQPEIVLESILEALYYPAWIKGPDDTIVANSPAKELVENGLLLSSLLKKRNGFTYEFKDQVYRLNKRELDSNHILYEFKIYDFETRRLKSLAVKLEKAINNIK